MHRSALRSRLLTAASLVAVGSLGLGLCSGLNAAQLFDAMDVDQTRFVVVAVPIGSSGTKAQLQIYEQVNVNKRPCYEVLSGSPATVLPLLGTFDFTGICRRFIDSQGYSARVGTQDLGSSYRFVVRKTATDNLLVAAPAGADTSKPEMVVARTSGTADPTVFLEFKLEPGWRVTRRAYGGRALGHVYLHTDAWPSQPDQAAGANPTASQMSQSQPTVPPATPPKL